MICSNDIKPFDYSKCNTLIENRVNKIKFNTETKECFDMNNNFLGYGIDRNNQVIIINPITKP